MVVTKFNLINKLSLTIDILERVVTLAKISERNSIRTNLSYSEMCFRTIQKKSKKRLDSRSMEIGKKGLANFTPAGVGE